MGCQSSMCADSSELILSQQLGGKLSDVTAPTSEKSTYLSLHSQQRKEGTTSPESVRKFYVLKGLIKIVLQDLPNYADLTTITDFWLKEVKSLIQTAEISPDDLKTLVLIDSHGESLTVKHEVDGVRSFDMAKKFHDRAKGLIGKELDLKSYTFKESFLLSLSPLTISFYLKLGKSVDFGIGVEKPIDRKQLSSFLLSSKEAVNISNWTSLNNQPIPTALGFSLLSSERFVNFYIFDGLKTQNIDRGFSIFEEFGAPVSTEVKNLFSQSTGDEVNCLLEFDETAVKTISLNMQNDGLCEQMLGIVDSQGNPHKWTTFHHIAPAKFIGLHLNSAGFVLHKTSLL
jgi:hypothetical protein